VVSDHSIMPSLTDATLQQRRRAPHTVLRGPRGRELTVEERRDLLILVVWPELFGTPGAGLEAA
jgi:hypothetical protein